MGLPSSDRTSSIWLQNVHELSQMRILIILHKRCSCNMHTHDDADRETPGWVCSLLQKQRQPPWTTTRIIQYFRMG